MALIVALAAVPGMLGTQEAIRQGQQKERREEHRARRCNLIARCIKSSFRSKEISGRPLVLRDGAIFIDTCKPDNAVQDHQLAGYFLPYPDSTHEGLVTTVTDIAPIMNWVYVDSQTQQLRYGIRKDAQPNITGPFDCTRQDRRLTFQGWEGFCAVELDPGVWTVVFDVDDDGLQTKMEQGIIAKGTQVVEIELCRVEKRWKKDVTVRTADQTVNRGKELDPQGMEVINDPNSNSGVPQSNALPGYTAGSVDNAPGSVFKPTDKSSEQTLGPYQNVSCNEAIQVQTVAPPLSPGECASHGNSPSLRAQQSIQRIQQAALRVQEAARRVQSGCHTPTEPQTVDFKSPGYVASHPDPSYVASRTPPRTVAALEDFPQPPTHTRPSPTVVSPTTVRVEAPVVLSTHLPCARRNGQHVPIRAPIASTKTRSTTSSSAQSTNDYATLVDFPPTPPLALRRIEAFEEWSSIEEQTGSRARAILRRMGKGSIRVPRGGEPEPRSAKDDEKNERRSRSKALRFFGLSRKNNIRRDDEDKARGRSKDAATSKEMPNSSARDPHDSHQEDSPPESPIMSWVRRSLSARPDPARFMVSPQRTPVSDSRSRKHGYHQPREGQQKRPSAPQRGHGKMEDARFQDTFRPRDQDRSRSGSMSVPGISKSLDIRRSIDGYRQYWRR